MASPTDSFSIEPTLKIFFSVDIVGSTKYKHEITKKEMVTWLPFFFDFFEDFPTYFRRNVTAQFEKAENVQLCIVEIWKTLGDELLFQTSLTDSKQASILLKAFVLTIEEYNEIIAVSSKESNLRLKGTAWVSGFPVSNAEITAGEKIDFIGPGIDLGFRLSKLSSDTKTVISIGLALLILKNAGNDLEFGYDSRSQLKGITSQKGYPIIYVRVKSSKENEIEANLIKKIYQDELLKFVEFYYKENSLDYPFINGDSQFNTKPKNYEENFSKVKKMLSESYKHVGT